MLNKASKLFLISLLTLFIGCKGTFNPRHEIDLHGKWRFAMDEKDEGIERKWYEKKLEEEVTLPGSMTTNGKGKEVDVNTPWTGGINDSAWFTEAEYAPYRKAGNVKVPYWLQPTKYYKGAAWYQKDVDIPEKGYEDGAELFIERSHWESTVWIDNKKVGMKNSLATAHRYDLTGLLTPGKHTITIRIDNRVKDIDVGPNSHSISDHTQSNWNGMIGKLYIKPLEKIRITDLQLFPDVQRKEVLAKFKITNKGAARQARIHLQAALKQKNNKSIKDLTQELTIVEGDNALEIAYPMGENPAIWDEFNPTLYEMNAQLNVGDSIADQQLKVFGMRNFATKGRQILLNDKPVFFRGTLESAIFPKTGFPPTDIASWAEIFSVCKDYGLNHIRFHSWCPPEAAFDAADSIGMYLQIECSSWANQGSGLGDGKPIDQFIYDESERIVKDYGNHPSFSLMAYGNEPGGKNHKQFLTEFVKYWKKKDSRRLYTSAAGWPAIPENDYNDIPEPRIQGWGEGLNSIINKEIPRSNYDWLDDIKQFNIPTISHEIGQWCVYPDFKEIKEYTGVLKAKNFEIFRDKLKANGMADLAEKFLMASGKLQALCYKADIEAALRTPGFSGFQLLDLHDFPGQGTALVGVLNPFWKSKGYIDAKGYSEFCNSTVPLARFPKMNFLNTEAFNVPIEIAHYGNAPLQNETPIWTITDKSGKVYATGALKKGDIPIGHNFSLGSISANLQNIKEASQLTLKVRVGDFTNSWHFFVYPNHLTAPSKEIYVTQQLDEKAKTLLNSGGSVLLTLKKGTLKPEKGGDIAVGFSSIFWNTAWTKQQPPVTLGILCDPKHPALANFPTEYHSDWQWWDAMTHCNTIKLDAIDPSIDPIVRVIDDWVTARPLSLLFECKMGKGSLLVSGIDFLTDIEHRPESRQLLYSLTNYMNSQQFNPKTKVDEKVISDLSN